MKRVVFWVVVLLVAAGVAIWAISRPAPEAEILRDEAVFPEAGTPLAEQYGIATLVWQGTIRNIGDAGSMKVTVTAAAGGDEWVEVRTIELDAGAQEELAIPFPQVPADVQEVEVQVRVDPLR